MKARLLLAIGLIAVAAFATPIPNVLGTGVTVTNTPLITAQSGANVLDPRFSVTGPGPFLYTPVTYNVLGTYFTETSTGPNRWISAFTFNAAFPSTAASAPGVYAFSYTFDMTGLNPSSAVINGRWGTDNCGEIWLNGLYTGVSIGGGNTTCNTAMTNFTSLTAFSLNNANSQFGDGPNTIEFRVYNEGGPVGLMVTNVEANAHETPEAGTYALVGTALDVLGSYRIHRR